MFYAADDEEQVISGFPSVGIFDRYIVISRHSTEVACVLCFGALRKVAKLFQIETIRKCCDVTFEHPQCEK